MRKPILAAAATACALLLAGCTTGQDTTQETPATTAPTTEKATIGTPVTVTNQITGDTFTLTVDEMTIGAACTYGGDTTSSLNDPSRRLQISGQISDYKNSPDWEGNEIMMLDDPTILDTEGVTQPLDVDLCGIPDDGHTYWRQADLAPGQKKKVYGAFVLPVGADKIDTIAIGNAHFDPPTPTETTPDNDNSTEEIPATDSGDTAGGEPVHGQAATTVGEPVTIEVETVYTYGDHGAPQPTDNAPYGFTGAPGVDQPRSLDKTISHCGGENHQPGTTFFTDGTTGWTAQCASQ